jgi:RNA polymerase sigma factor (sigma-70 family)
VTELITLVKTYRLSTSIADRATLGDQIFYLIEPDLRYFVFSNTAPDVAEDILQEVLRAIAISLDKFTGQTKGAFWAWCYAVAKNQTAAYFRKQKKERAKTVPEFDLWDCIEASAESLPLSAAVRHDLEFAMELLAKSKEECRDYLNKYFIVGLDYREIAEEQNIAYDSVRMRISRCLEEAKSLIS